MSLLKYDQALAVVLDKVVPIGLSTSVGLIEAVGLALARDLKAVEANPRFDNSAVDGYAFGRAEDAVEGSRLKIVGEIAAGGAKMPIPKGACVRVLTGAPVPENAFAVIMQEDTLLDDGHLVLGISVVEGRHIRRTASDIAVGAPLLKAGATITAGAVALLASQGFNSINVFRPPIVGLVTTGNELVDIDAEPKDSELRDTNQPMLEARLRQLGVREIRAERVKDDYKVVRGTLERLVGKCDVVVVCGGASVGDYDFVPAAVAELGSVEFHGVAVRPGKPVLFGFVADTPCFGLPGNPASSFVCFELFVRSALLALGGHNSSKPLWTEARYAGKHKPEPRDVFERASLSWNEGRLWAEPLPLQESFGLRSLAQADALVRLPANQSLALGDSCQVLPI